MIIYLQTTFRRMRIFIQVLALFLPKGALLALTTQTPVNSGELDGDLSVLARYYAPPVIPGESNYFIDMWSGGEMEAFAREHGLTNNRALFVISHARALRAKGRLHYALYPGQSRISRGTKTAYYSPGDIARVLGVERVNQIENLIVSGCNSENVFRLAEWKTCFPKATNIIHAAPGKDGYDFLLRHALIYRSAEIKWLYDMPDSFTIGRFDEKTNRKNRPKLNLYLASLYQPGATDPYTVQIAGRELLEPPRHIETAKATVPQPAPIQTGVVQAAVPAVEPKIVARREPIIMRGTPHRSTHRRSVSLQTRQPPQAEAAMGILAVVFGGCCIAWSFGLESGSNVSEPYEQAESMPNEPTPNAPNKLLARLRNVLSQNCRRSGSFLRRGRRGEEKSDLPNEPVSEG